VQEYYQIVRPAVVALLQASRRVMKADYKRFGGNGSVELPERIKEQHEDRAEDLVRSVSPHVRQVALFECIECKAAMSIKR